MLRCPRCGNENPEPNRFCGMCGASLLGPSAGKPAEPVSVATPVPVTEVANAPVHVAEKPRPLPVEKPSISGPSFLGLSDPPSRSAPRTRASLSIDPHPPGRSLDYLLEEEEAHHHWGIGKILVILIALGLAIGFGYLRFKNQGLAWLKGVTKPTAVAQSSSTPDTPAANPSSPSITPDPQPPAQPTPQPTTPPATASTQPGNTATSNTPTASTPSTPIPADSGRPADTPKPDSDAPVPASDKATPSTDKDSTTTDDSPKAAAAAIKHAERPKPSPKLLASKPSATTPAGYDPVSEARKYIYGRGAPQDCDRGLRLLKPAANQSNPKAMVEMGALYSAGLCTPHDLPTAYRWFALALRKDPENNAIQSDLQKLWGEMTQPERQLAIKMTQ